MAPKIQINVLSCLLVDTIRHKAIPIGTERITAYMLANKTFKLNKVFGKGLQNIYEIPKFCEIAAIF